MADYVKPKPQPPLPKRNVFIVDPSGHTIAGFWQYGYFTFAAVYDCLHQFLLVNPPSACALISFDPLTQIDGAVHSRSDVVVQPGTYKVVSDDGLAMTVFLSTDLARTRFPTHSTAGPHDDDYRQRARERDNKCVITGVQHASYSRLRAAHIFPRAHEAEFRRKGFTAQITDPAPLCAVGGSTKIDSIQNIILIDSSLHDGWDAYEFSIDPDRNYRVTAFINGYCEYDGLHVDFSHITDPRLHPLDDLLRDHFLQGVLKHMKGAGEADEEWDPSDDLGKGYVNLEQVAKWGSAAGRKALEFVLADKLHMWRVNQGTSVS